MAETAVVLKKAFAERLLEVVRWWERIPKDAGADVEMPVENAIVFRNDSGHTIPPYGLCQSSGTHENVLNYLTVKRPFDYAACQGVVVVNGPFEVPNGEFGTAQSGPVYIVIHDAAITYAVGDRMGWKANSFLAGLGTPFVYLGADDIATNACRVMCDFSSMTGQSIAPIAAGASGPVYRRKANSGGFATDTTRSYLAYNDTGTAVNANSRIKMFSIDGRWVIVEVC